MIRYIKHQFDRRFPKKGIAGKLAAIAVVSIPVALVAGAGYGVYRGSKALRERFREETDEDKVSRLERAHREFRAVR